MGILEIVKADSVSDLHGLRIAIYNKQAQNKPTISTQTQKASPNPRYSALNSSSELSISLSTPLTT